MQGLDPTLKSFRVCNFHDRTVHAACDIVGAMGFDDFDLVDRKCVMRRVGVGNIRTFDEIFPKVESGFLIAAP